MYQNGKGVPQDDAEAVKWFRLGAAQGYAPAQVKLGSMYSIGAGVPQDYAQAFYWLNLAAVQGDSMAQLQVGALYSLGQGVRRDFVQAYFWLSLSAAQGNAKAVKARDLVSARMTPNQIAEAQRLASEWKPIRSQ